jgi:hypothetical protein
MRAELAYEPVISFDDGVRRAIEWERANPPERIKPEWLDFRAEDAAYARISAGR